MKSLARGINAIMFAAFKLLCRTCTSDFNRREAVLDFRARTHVAVASGEVPKLARICFRFLRGMLWRSADEQRERLHSIDWGAGQKMWKWGKAFVVLSLIMFPLVCYWEPRFQFGFLVVAAGVLIAFIIPAFIIDCALELDPYISRSSWSGLTRMHFAFAAAYGIGAIVYDSWHLNFYQIYQAFPLLILAGVNYYLYNIVPAKRVQSDSERNV